MEVKYKIYPFKKINFVVLSIPHTNSLTSQQKKSTKYT
jgi:hypothetical protein